MVRQHLLDGKGRFFYQSIQKGGRVGRGFLIQNLYIDPPGGTVNCGKQVPMFALIRHFRKILDIDMDESRFIIFKGFLDGVSPSGFR